MWKILRCMQRFGVRIKQENCVKGRPQERDGGLVGSIVNAKFTLGLVICRTVTPVRLMPLAPWTYCTARAGHAELGVTKSLHAWSPMKTNGEVLAGKGELVLPCLPGH